MDINNGRLRYVWAIQLTEPFTSLAKTAANHNTVTDRWWQYSTRSLSVLLSVIEMTSHRTQNSLSAINCICVCVPHTTIGH